MDQQTGSEIGKYVEYAIINNIPGSYHSSHLRDYFSQFIESDGFDCFHFRHRPEKKIHFGNEATTSTNESDDVTQTSSASDKSLPNVSNKVLTLRPRRASSHPKHPVTNSTRSESSVVPYTSDTNHSKNLDSTTCLNSKKPDRSKQPISHKSDKTSCCVIRLRDGKLAELLNMYHRRHWVDDKGETLPLKCLISKVKVQAGGEFSLSFSSTN